MPIQAIDSFRATELRLNADTSSQTVSVRMMVSLNHNPRLQHMDEIAQYWLVLKRRWLPAALVFALTTALAAAYTFKQTPIYQAKGQVILKKTNKTSALLSSSSVPGIGDLEGLTGSSPVTTQVEVIKSNTTIKGVIAKLLDEKYKTDSPERKRLEKLAKKTELFASQLKVSSIKGTDILEVSFQDTSQKLTRDVVDTIMSVYIGNDQTNQRQEAKAAREFVREKLPEMQKEVEKAEAEIRGFKERNKVTDLPTESVKTVETIANLKKDITSVTAQLAAESSKLEGLKNLFGGQDTQATIQSGLLSESPGLQKSLRELQEVESKLALERTRFSDNDQSIISLTEKRQALRDILADRYKNSLLGNKNFQGKLVEIQAAGIQGGLIQDLAKSEALKTSLQQQLAAIIPIYDEAVLRKNQLPELEQKQNALGRKLETTRTNYKTLLSKLQEIEIAENQTLGNSRIQAPAELPEEPISPKKGQNIAIGGFLGLFLGAATAFAMDSADKRIKTAEEARQLLPSYPVLGQIPVFEKTRALPKLGNAPRDPGQLVMNGTSGIEGESFRMLQTNLQFMNVDNSLKVLVMSSSQSGEGKSTVTANLALAMAELGKRVLLVDADMRKPTQHKIWRQSNYEGLSNVLSGQCDQKSAITEVQSNVFLMTAGVVPPNPVVLIDSDQMNNLIATWADSYDIILIDAPPITVAADASLLGTQAGTLLFVIRPGVADKESVEYAQEILTQSKIKVLGMVLNGVDVDKQKRYNSYYYNSQLSRSDEGNAGSKLLPGMSSSRDS